MQRILKGENMKKIIIIILFLTITFMCYTFAPRNGVPNTDELWFPQDTLDITTIQTIEKQVGEDFKILQLTDTQISTTLEGKQLTEIVTTLVEENDPDLIIITGDLSQGPYNAQNIKYQIKLFDSFEIPWAPIFGNHDAELGADKYYLAELYNASEYCLFECGPYNIKGVGNYVINIVEDDLIIQSLYMIDSGQYMDSKKLFTGDYDYIGITQIEWYKWNVEQISINELGTYDPLTDTVVPSMAFFHIPLPEFDDAYTAWEESDYDTSIGKGDKEEDICDSPINSHFFEVIKEYNSTKYIMVGHDHVNNFEILYQGVTLKYGLKTGTGSYFTEGSTGGTLITITAADNSITIEDKVVT